MGEATPELVSTLTPASGGRNAFHVESIRKALRSSVLELLFFFWSLAPIFVTFILGPDLFSRQGLMKHVTDCIFKSWRLGEVRCVFQWLHVWSPRP